MIQVSDAISWLKENSERKLIITMPLDSIWRSYIEANLWEYNDKCIALDPAILLCWTHTMFRNTQVLQVWILGQIKKLISKDTVSV